ncbi:MAG: S-layer homology domain-containing protein, partial [Oscillospiraceae bacterium]|nr:S-layer homology domain-containing protein [Oscillospiraceae bacterium]
MKKGSAMTFPAAFALALMLALAVAIPTPAAYAVGAPVRADEAPAWYSGYAPFIAAYQTVEDGGPLPTLVSEGFALRHAAFLGTMKYTLYDINGNGAPELIVGISDDFTQYYACDVYTMDGGSAALLISGGWESSIAINTRSISYFEGHVIGYDEEFLLSPDGQLILVYSQEYDYMSDEVISETGVSLGDTPAALVWKPLSEYANELSSSQSGAPNAPSDWAVDEVNAAISAGLVPQSLRQNYQSPVSRGSVAGMFIDLIEKSSGQPIDALLAANGVAINDNAFDDTDDRAVLAANALGIINGVGNRRFDPNGTLTRAQVAAIINRIARVLGVDTDGYSHQFTDVGGHWVSVELGWPVHSSIISGVGNNRFDPDAELTTEQAILIVGRALAPLSEAAQKKNGNDGFDVINVGDVVNVIGTDTDDARDAADAADSHDAADAADARDTSTYDAYYSVYESLIAEWKLTRENHISSDYIAEGMFSFYFYSGSGDFDSYKAYYALYDIDGNGVPELILRKQNKSEDIIAYIYVIKDGKPINLFGYYDNGSGNESPNEVPWARTGTSSILTNGYIDSTIADYCVYKINEDGYSLIKVTDAVPYDYPDMAGLAEAKWRYYINGIEVEYDEHKKYLDEQVKLNSGNDAYNIIN